MNRISKSIDVGGKTLTIQTGHLAKQANGSCLVSMGDTVVLVAVVAAKEPKEGGDFLPLTVDYRERTYAAGKIPGGFFKREGRPREKEILSSRIVDRSIRPLFDEKWKNETQVSILVLSFDGENDPDVLSVIGASSALRLSNVPFTSLLSCVRIGRIDGKLIVNPTLSERKLSDLDLLVSGKSDALCMVEAGANEMSEQEMLAALNFAQDEIKKICAFQETLPAKDKMALIEPEKIQELESEIKNTVTEQVKNILTVSDKTSRDEQWSSLKKAVVEKHIAQYPEKEGYIDSVLENIFYCQARELILGKKVRSDGRQFDEIRPIECNIGVLPRAHGSAVFTRGQTQSLATVTLGSPQDMQIKDELEGEYKERFMLHYNFPGFATGESKPERGTSRRETGHGALARKSLLPLLPKEDDFPYTIRVVSDILESNGSSSMASVCGGSLALFDAGVPIKSSCAGVAMGLVKEGETYAILTDIMGMEDHLGDMDFKVAGTKNGITALQMDIKISGLSAQLMSEALEKARAARLKILEKMETTIASPKSDISSFAPRMLTIMIPQSKIGELIGPGGKNIRKIQEDTKVEINIEEDGRVFISSPDKAAVEAARTIVEALTQEAEVGKVYKGRVTRLMNFGAFVEILPGKEGLVHISQLAEKRVAKVEDVVKEGDEITVKVIEIDNQGRINLSKKAVDK
ncbi:MAG: polyribonucleotide nucleotidyltransferase [Elusimicrobia bacterium]|nr:polyribonucleotide nucleotidyltransferase [Candidatus Liberimonas magnetica]